MSKTSFPHKEFAVQKIHHQVIYNLKRISLDTGYVEEPPPDTCTSQNMVWKARKSSLVLLPQSSWEEVILWVAERGLNSYTPLGSNILLLQTFHGLSIQTGSHFTETCSFMVPLLLCYKKIFFYKSWINSIPYIIADKTAWKEVCKWCQIAHC